MRRVLQDISNGLPVLHYHLFHEMCPELSIPCVNYPEKKTKIVFCYQNCSDLLWEKIVLVIEKNFRNLKKLLGFRNMPEKLKMVFCYQNCSDLLWEKIVLVIKKKLLKFEVEDREFAKILRSLEQFIQTVKGQNNFW